MTRSEANQVLSRAMQPASYRVRKDGRFWFVTEAETLGLWPSTFKTRKAALAAADRSGAAGGAGRPGPCIHGTLSWGSRPGSLVSPTSATVGTSRRNAAGPKSTVDPA
jgi:hypothetical protein